jgi:hypothetical protein
MKPYLVANIIDINFKVKKMFKKSRFYSKRLTEQGKSLLKIFILCFCK